MSDTDKKYSSRSGLSLRQECEYRAKEEKRGMDRRSRSSSIRKDHVRHVTISSSSSSRSRSRTRSRSLSSLSRSRSRSRSGSRHRHRHRHSKRRRRSRSRSRSRKSRSRSESKKEFTPKTSGYLGTNSRDPKMVASRIFIGNLPMADVSKEDLEAIYGKYGKILGVTVRPGFGFIQFEKEQEASNAVAGERGSMLKGFQLDVKMATDGRSREEREGSPSWKAREPAGYMPPRPPIPPVGMGMYRPPLPGHPMGPMHGPFFGPPLPGPFPRGPLPPPDHFRRNPFSEPYHGEQFPPDFTLRHGFPPHPHATVRPPPVPSPPTVDCEIIVVDPKQRMYADNIKKRLMAAGIVTEMNFVADLDVPIELEEAARRRMMFAVIVNEQNEMHRSITVNILHGIPQEHRNMPLDDAVTLITRSYDKYLLERKERAGAVPHSSHPDDFLPANPRVQFLLNLLADHRFLTIVELTDVIAYLEERRRMLSNSQENTRPMHPQDRELESRKQPDPYPSYTPENRRLSDVDERADMYRDRLAQSTDMNRERMGERLTSGADLNRERVGDLNRERLATGVDLNRDRLGDLSRERSSLGADLNRERMGDFSRERLGQAADLNRERLGDLSRERLAQGADLNRERLSMGDINRDRSAYSGDLNRERLSMADSSVDRYSQELKRERMASAERSGSVDMARSSTSDNNRHVEYDRSAPVSSANQASDMSIANILSTSINFDSPSVKQALDNLMSGGPSIFKSVSDTVGQKGPGSKYPDGDSRF